MASSTRSKRPRVKEEEPRVKEEEDGGGSPAAGPKQEPGLKEGTGMKREEAAVLEEADLVGGAEEVEEGGKPAKRRRRQLPLGADPAVAVEGGRARGGRARKDPANPFPQHRRPSPAESTEARDLLARLHGQPVQAVPAEGEAPAAGGALEAREHGQQGVLDSLARTILSQNTTDTTSQRAFESLKRAFPTWEAVLAAGPGEVEEAIRVGGLADIKAGRLRAILATLQQERGECSLEHLRGLSDPEVKAQLTRGHQPAHTCPVTACAYTLLLLTTTSRFKGVGPKTVACVLMFCLRRAEFPVDTHVWRIAKRLGWVPPKATRDEAYTHLNARVPPEVKYDLHVLLVEHGKCCPACAQGGKNRRSPLGPCPFTSDWIRQQGKTS